MTNISSIPIPRQMKGKTACIGVYGKPKRELIPIEMIMPMAMLKRPVRVR